MTQRIVILHTAYGCDTGCCGHILEVDGERIGEFDFQHSLGSMTAEELREEFEPSIIADFGVEHAATLAWEEENILRLAIGDC